jgi:hypothetical protein
MGARIVRLLCGDGTRDASGAQALVGAVGILAAALAALGAVTGSIARVERNEFRLLMPGVLCVVLAIALGVIGLTVAHLRTCTVRLGAGTLLAGMALSVLAVLFAARDQAQPSVVAFLREAHPGDYVMQATIDANDLLTTNHLRVLVEGIAGDAGEARTTLYAAVLGPDASGNVTDSFQVPLGHVRYDQVEVRAWIGDPDRSEPADCTTGSLITAAHEREPRGCVTVRVPDPQAP